MVTLQDKMENGSSSNSHQNQPSEGLRNASNGKPMEKDVFINHAEIAWHQRRREWVGDQSQNLRRPPGEQIMSLTTTYEDVLLSTEPFQHRIPLAEMVDFLVDIWHEEGLYD
ncbi:Zinc finger protein [Quillaja saponaria]|uniref:Zinc finger protein n=1 Tax=Quillaja saponaria TaxID=32244 RepID=A0AAD7Q8L0_QUISA|nr:Zinc finger protein [Quillaja saponaria]